MVYITGDLHGEKARFSDPAMRVLRKGDTLIVCGDFGFLWNGGKAEKRFLKKLGALPYQLLFLDGCHENYDLLREYPVTDWNGGRAQVIEGKLVHLLRGEVYTLEGESYFTFGGGETSDPTLRADARTWWEAEMPTAEEMQHGLETLRARDNRVHYILTHEPSGKASGYLPAGTPLNGVRIYLNQLEEAVEYRCWFFGCIHQDKTMSQRHRAVFQDVVPVHDSHARRR